MNNVYELLDITDGGVCRSLGVFSSFERALKTIQANDKGLTSEAKEKIVISERKIDDFSDYDIYVYTVTREWNYDTDKMVVVDEEYVPPWD